MGHIKIVNKTGRPVKVSNIRGETVGEMKDFNDSLDINMGFQFEKDENRLSRKTLHFEDSEGYLSVEENDKTSFIDKRLDKSGTT